MSAEQKSLSQMTPAMNVWLRKRVEEVLRKFVPSHRMGVAHHTGKDRIETIVRAYRDLWALGYKMEKVESLAPRHLVALAGSWRAKGLARSTVRTRWVHLTMWCIVIGKAGMAPSFNEIWPKEDTAEDAGESPKVVDRGLDRLSPGQYAELLRKLEQRTDQTGYWLVRCVHELGLTREEAVLFEPRVPRDLTNPVEVWSNKGRKRRGVILLDLDKRDLVVQVRDFMKSLGRERLGWREHSVVQMVTRYANLVRYAMAQLTEDPNWQGAGGKESSKPKVLPKALHDEKVYGMLKPVLSGLPRPHGEVAQGPLDCAVAPQGGQA